MANLGEFLNALFLNAGLDLEDQSLKEVVTKTATIDVADELTSKFNASYLTLNAAKNNTDLRKHFYALALNGLDTELDGVMGELGLDESVTSRIKEEKSSFKRASLLAKTIKELEASKAGATKADKAEIQRQIDALNAEVVRAKAEKENAIKETESLWKGKLNDVLLNNLFSNYEYAAPVSKDVNVKIARQMLDEEIGKKGYRLETGEEGFRLVNSEGMEVYENNQKVTFKDFSDRLLAQHNLLKTAAPAAPQSTPTPGNHQPVVVQTTQQRNAKFASRAEQLAQEALRDLNS